MIGEQEPTVCREGLTTGDLKTGMMTASKSRLSGKTLTFSANTPTTSVDDDNISASLKRRKRKAKKCPYCGGYARTATSRQRKWYDIRWYRRICCCCCHHFRLHYRLRHRQQQHQPEQHPLSPSSATAIKECICCLSGAGIGVGELLLY